MKAKIKIQLTHLFTVAKTFNIRDRLYAKRAQRQSRTRLARLMLALASSEAVHARRLLMYLRGKLVNSDAYLQAYLETKQAVLTVYQHLALAMRTEQKKSKAENFHQFTQVVRRQIQLLETYRNRRNRLDAALYVCQVCGFIQSAAAPLNCPVCNAIQSKFQKFE